MIHIIRDLDLASGGPSRSVPALAQAQSVDEKLDIRVLYRERGNPVVPIQESRARVTPLSAGQMLSGGALKQIVGRDAETMGNRLFHIHGLWSPALHVAARFARRSRIPYVISTRGMLASWALGHKARKKQMGWKLYQHRDLQESDYLIASSESEGRDISRLLPHSPLRVIPNGCEDRPVRLHEAGGFPPGPNGRWALALGRLHPVKGYAGLIEAWAKLRPAEWNLAIAGPDEDGYRKVLQGLIDKHQLPGRIFLLGPVDDVEKWTLLDQCELFIAPSKTENFGMAIAEALQSGTPVLTTTGTPWRELEELDCGWWVAPEVEMIHQALAVATAMDARNLEQMGERGRKLVQEKYSWRQVAKTTVELYREVLRRA